MMQIVADRGLFSLKKRKKFISKVLAGRMGAIVFSQSADPWSVAINVLHIL